MDDKLIKSVAIHTREQPAVDAGVSRKAQTKFGTQPSFRERVIGDPKTHSFFWKSEERNVGNRNSKMTLQRPPTESRIAGVKRALMVW